MPCVLGAELCRARHIAAKLTDIRPASGDFEARCPVCGHGSFRVSKPREARARWRNIWGCACRGRCRCNDAAQLRAALLALSIPARCLGDYALDMKPAGDPFAAPRLREAVDLILAWPGCDPSQMRIILAEARGDKFPGEYGELARFFQRIGVGRRHSYNLAAEHCRPPDSPPHPGGGSADAKS